MNLQEISNWMEHNEWRPVIAGAILSIMLIAGILLAMMTAGCGDTTYITRSCPCKCDRPVKEQPTPKKQGDENPFPHKNK